MEDRGSRTKETSRRISLKSHARSKYPTWKHKLRENCYKRVKEERNRLIWKMRLTGSQSHDQKDTIKSTIEDIMSEEMEKIKDMTRSSLDTSNAPSDLDEILWDYEGLQDTTYGGDCQEILLEMQKIFYEDLRDDTTPKESYSHIDAWEDEEDEFLARLVLENMHLNSEQERKQVWCPICKQGEVLEHHQLIYCSLCELQLNKDAAVNLQILEDRLAEVHLDHFDRGCKAKPSFCMETRFDLRALYISCDSCKIFEIVL